MDPLALVPVILLSAGAGLAVAWGLIVRQQRGEAARQAADLALRKRELELAQAEAAARQQAALEADRRGQEQVLLERTRRLDEREQHLRILGLELDRSKADLDARETAANAKGHELERREAALDKLTALYRQRLEDSAGMERTEAAAKLLEETKRELEDELRDLRYETVRKAESEYVAEARRILVDTIQRLAGQPHNDLTATIVPLASEDLKGRIIGREGRNIKAFESATGVTLLIDETPDSVLISSFDPVRREVAQRALAGLLKDGRIHPSSIEEAVARAQEEVRQNVREHGERAIRELGLTRVAPEVIELVGKLNYRLSNNQNSLDHSLEVARLCGLMAQELGLDPVLARRAGLFHDIGKAMADDREGSHATVAADLLARGGEPPEVVNAVAASHQEVPATSPYAGLLLAADAISASRPGARAESLDSYLRRVRQLEDVAKSCEGVQDAYAIQAGREIRVLADAAKLRDDEARALARQIRRRIEEELQYPGTIKVTVIREARFQETAR